jgi:hypothetical protein
VLLPGSRYETWEDPDLGGGFDRPAVAGMLTGTVQF